MGKLVALVFGTFGGSTAVCHEGKGGSDNSLHQHSHSTARKEKNLPD